jgi:hypothetical protein
MQEFMVFRPCEEQKGLVGIRYLSTFDGSSFKIVNGMEYGNAEKRMLLDNAREAWYSLVKEGWGHMYSALPRNE